MNFRIKNIVSILLLLTLLLNVVDALNDSSLGVSKSIKINLKVDNASGIQKYPVEVRKNVQVSLGINLIVDNNFMNDLIDRKIEDNKSFQSVSTLTKLVREDKKEIIAKEMLRMNKNFLNEFIISDENKTNQLIDYSYYLYNAKSIQVQIIDKNINSLFAKDIDLDSFISNIWDN